MTIMYDSVKVRIDEIIPGSPSSLKEICHILMFLIIVSNRFSYIKDNIVVDSIYSINSFSDTLKTMIQNSIIS